MSESIRRRSSSRQLLQNLIRVTAQRSQEDAEEVERERRRRAREKQRGDGSPSWPEPPHHDDLTHDTELDEELKPSCCLVLEEDEGFSDWSHRLENRSEQEVQDDCRARVQTASAPQRKPGPEEEKQHRDKEEQDKSREPERSSRSQEASIRPPEKMSSNRKEGRTSYSSSVFLQQDTRLQHATGQPADRTSYLAAGTMKPRGGACRVDGQVEQEELKEEVQPTLQREWRSAETRQSPGDEDDQEEEELRFTHEESEELHLRREQGHREEEEEEEEEHMMPDKSSVESRDRCSSPSKPAEIKPGGVLNKKNLWESLGDTLSPGKDGKESSPGKRYKFVVAGHGKYEKVPVDTEDVNFQSAGQFYEDL